MDVTDANSQNKPELIAGQETGATPVHARATGRQSLWAVLALAVIAWSQWHGAGYPNTDVVGGIAFAIVVAGGGGWLTVRLARWARPHAATFRPFEVVVALLLALIAIALLLR